MLGNRKKMKFDKDPPPRGTRVSYVSSYEVVPMLPYRYRELRFKVTVVKPKITKYELSQ
jgi:hypothetical protein